MEKKNKEILSMVLLLTVTAAVFFLLGLWADTIFGAPNRPATEIEYVPDPTSATTNSVPSQSSDITADTTPSESDGSTTTVTVTYPINLNTATKEELMTIKGIGETYAQRILEYRDEINGFDYLEQLMEIEGIGEGRFTAWSPYLTVE